jgi:hypothetical protein
MGLRPTQGDEKRVLFSNYCCWKRRPPLLSSRPERSVVERSAVSAVLPLGMFFDRAQRRGGTCGSAVSSWAIPVQQLRSPEAPSSPLSSRPERSVVERSAVSAVLPWECFRQSAA